MMPPKATPLARASQRCADHETVSRVSIAPSRWSVQAIRRNELAGLGCEALHEQAANFSALPAVLRADGFLYMAALALEATDRALHGCPCGSLVSREAGTCGLEGTEP
jgi:hypothetical protein